MTPLTRTALCAVLTLSLPACDGDKKLSQSKAAEHVVSLVETATGDVQEIKNGLPEGAKHLAKLFEGGAAPKDDLPAVREALDKARNKVQDLRVAKSTFFALVDDQGTVLRNDQDQDLMAGKNAFQSFPGLKAALDGKYVETRGSMPEAAKVKGTDGQWVAAAPIQVGDKTRALYATGFSWSAYAYRLENSLRSSVRSSMPANKKEPLIYVYVVVDKQVFGAPVSPEVNAQAIATGDPLAKAQGDAVFSSVIEITGRDFGLGIKRAPALGAEVAVAVLRSET
ncbi:MAG: hypothetical protein IT375_11235 [Polyangiaceae bacterium]|nr:hypothetical protein [Polyangiaceae bacterium]